MNDGSLNKARFKWRIAGVMLAAILGIFGIAFAANAAGANEAIADDTSNVTSSTPISISIKATNGGSATLEKASYNSGENVVIKWRGSKISNSNDLLVPTSITCSGTGVTYTMSQIINVSELQSENKAYEEEMGGCATMMTYDALENFVANEQSFSLGKQTLSGTIIVNFARVTPVYRLYNKVTSEHLFTTDKKEYDDFVYLLSKHEDNWIGEGVDWLAPSKTNSGVSNTATIKRLYNEALGSMFRSSHYYTSDEAEIKDLTENQGWVVDDDGTWFASGSTTGASASIFTAYSELLGSAHHYTSSWDEWNSLDAGWDHETVKNGISKDGKTATGVAKALLGTNWRFTENYYKVEHKIDNKVVDTEYAKGVAGQTTTATAKTYAGYSQSGKISQKTIAADNSTVVDVNYSPNKYTITYNVGDHGKAPTPTTVLYGSKISAPTAPTAEGVTFNGWYYDQAHKNAVKWTTMPATDMTVYAYWTTESTGKTGTDGNVSLFDLSTSKVLTTTVLCEDGTAISGATVTIGKNGNIVVKLPSSGDNKTVSVSVASDEGAVKSRSIELKNSAGVHKNTETTSETGDATFKKDESAADKSGKGSVYDDTTETAVSLTITDESGKAISGAKFSIDESTGIVSVTLPEGADSKGVQLKLTDKDGKAHKASVVLYNSDSTKRAEGSTDDDGYVAFDKGSGTTGDNGEVTIYDSGASELIKMTVKRTDGTFVSGANVSVSDEGLVTVRLPKGADSNDVTIKIENKSGAVKGKSVELEVSDGSHRSNGETNDSGEVAFKANSGITDSAGMTSPYDKKSTDNLLVSVIDFNNSPVEGATVTLSDNGQVTVKLPDGESYEGIRVNLDGSEVSGRIVTITDASGSVKGMGTTDADGEVEINTEVSSGYLDTSGKLTLSHPTTGETYQIELTGESGASAPEGALVTLDGNGQMVVTMPNESFDEVDLTAKVLDGAGTARQGVDLSLVKHDGETERGHCVTAGAESVKFTKHTVKFYQDKDCAVEAAVSQTVYTGLTAMGPDTIKGKDGYTTDCDWHETTNDQTFDFLTPITADVNLYTIWTPITYTIKFTAGDGGSGTQDEMTVKYDEKIKLPECKFTAPTDKEFAGWAYGDKVYQAGDETLTNLTTVAYDEIGLTATWKHHEYTIKLYWNEGDEEAVKTVTAPVDENWPTAEEVSKTCETGKHLVGWKEKDCDTVYACGTKIGDPATSIDDTKTATYYAVVQNYTYTVYFNINGSKTGENQTVTLKLNEEGTVPVGTGLQKDGYYFAGWNDKEDGTGETTLKANDKITSKLTTESQADIEETYYAVWSPKLYMVHFSSNPPSGTTATGSMLSQGGYYGTTTLKECDFKIDGYTFAYWTIKDDTSGKKYYPGDNYSEFGDRTNWDNIYLEANWTQNTQEGSDD